MKYPIKQVGIKHIDWEGLALSTELPLISKALVMYLARFMNKDKDVAHPSRKRIESELSISRGALNKHLDILESEGWIIRERGNSVTTTRYSVSFPKMIDKVVHDVNHKIQGVVHDVNEGSSPDERRVVHDVNTNRQLNSQYNREADKPACMEKDWSPNETNIKWMMDSGLSESEQKTIIRDFVDFWILSKTKRKNWDLAFRKNPIVNRKINTKPKKTNGESYERQGYGETI